MSIQSRSNQYGTVFENWQILELLGQGSGGKTAVFRLKRIDSNRGQSALKVVNLIEERGDYDNMSAYLKKEYESARDECKNSALQEVYMMADFQGNTNIVDYLDHKFVDWTDESGFGCDMLIRMELLRDLRGEIRSGKAFSEADIVKVGCDICQALILCHGNGILHRDIKPENIFINRNGNYKLGDFGISRIISNAPMSMASTGIGTPEYAAPEQASGKYDKRVDIYSLGLVLYELSNQFHLPFAKSSYVRPDDVNIRMAGVPLPPPSAASKELCAIILRACAFKPEDRYQTAQEFADALIALAKQDSEYSSSRPIITGTASDVSRTVQGGSNSTNPAISGSYNTVPAHAAKGYETMPTVENKHGGKRDQYQTVPAGNNDLSVAQKAAPVIAPAKKKTKSALSFTELLKQSIKAITVAKPGKENKVGAHVVAEKPRHEHNSNPAANSEDIERLIQLAKKDSTGESQYRLGKMFSEGEKCAQNYEQAYKWFNTSAAWHYGPGLTALGDCFFYGRGVQKDQERGLKYYAEAYEQSDAEAAYRLGCWYEGIQPYSKNLSKAAQYFEKAAWWGCAPACYKIGKCYELGRGVKYDLHCAFNWYMRGADQDYIPAIMQVAYFYNTGKFDIPEDRNKWKEWTERAANLGDSSAQYELAKYYEAEGSINLAELLDKPDQVIESALAEAIRLYEQSAAQGYSMAKNGLESLQESLQSEADKGSNSRYSAMALRLLKLFRV